MKNGSARKTEDHALERLHGLACGLERTGDKSPLIIHGVAYPRKCPNVKTGADMTPYIPKYVSTWLINWALVSNSPPPRNPNDDEEEEEEEDEEDEDQDEEPPVVREPDE
jgi:hypothetical protein